jgi:hypothetical protein
MRLFLEMGVQVFIAILMNESQRIPKKMHIVIVVKLRVVVEVERFRSVQKENQHHMMISDFERTWK